ncbi:hypothetical protein [Sorangium sp. So ce1182]|uniref:hypothetical protein n=1 Tax=Sorangium sp. So ce1182 TaxID=3133334 RepID=UPI003F62B38D
MLQTAFMKSTPATLALLLPTRAVVLFFSGRGVKARAGAAAIGRAPRVARYCWPA